MDIFLQTTRGYSKWSFVEYVSNLQQLSDRQPNFAFIINFNFSPILILVQCHISKPPENARNP